MEQNIPQPDLKAIESAKSLRIQISNSLVKRGPTPKHGNKSRGVGITRKNKEESKKTKKLAKLQRKTNRKTANKKFRPSGSKQRK